jgi:predicted MFS family arabinose efflux permease
VLKVLRIRDFRLLWIGGTISALGSWLLVLAVPAHVFLVTNSLAATGLTLSAEYLPVLCLGPVAGVLTDRWNRRSLLITTGLFRALVVAAMLFGLAPGRYWVFYAALIAESAATTFAIPAQQARIPAIVGTGPALTSANSLNAVSSGLVGVLGGPLGGILLAALGIQVLIAADVLSYLVAGIAIMMTTREHGEQETGGGSGVRAILSELRSGLGLLSREPVARALLPVWVLFLAANASLTAIVVPFGIRQLGGSRATGLLFAALGVGYLLGAPVLKLTLDRFSPRYLLFLALAVAAGSYELLFGSASLATALPSAVAVGMFGSVALVIVQNTVQRVIPNAALGRISAVFLTGQAAATLAGAVAGPVLAQAIQLIGLVTIASAATAASAVLAVILVPTLGPGGESA